MVYMMRIFSDPAGLPSYSYLYDEKDENYVVDLENYQRILIVYMIYSIWMITQIVSLIILLNVLIAIVGKIYDNTISK